MAEDEAKEEQVKGIKMEEVEKHSSIDDLWLVIDGASPRCLFSDDDSARKAPLRLFSQTRSAALDRTAATRSATIPDPSLTHPLIRPFRQGVRRDALHG